MAGAAPIQSWLAGVSRFIGHSFLRVADRLARAGRRSEADGLAESLAELRLRYPEAPMHWLEAIAERMQATGDVVMPPAGGRSVARRARAVAGAEGREPDAPARPTRDTRRVEPASGADVSPRTRKPAEFLSPSQRLVKLRPVFSSQPASDKPVTPAAPAPASKAAHRPRVVFDAAQAHRTSEPSRVPWVEGKKSHTEKPATRADRTSFAAEAPAGKRASSWISQLPPARDVQALRATAVPPIAPAPQKRNEALPAVSIPHSREPAPIQWADDPGSASQERANAKGAPSRASVFEAAPAPGPVRPAPFAVADAASGGRWPELPPADFTSEPSRRAIDLVEKRARIERLKRDQTERLWNE